MAADHAYRPLYYGDHSITVRLCSVCDAWHADDDSLLFNEGARDDWKYALDRARDLNKELTKMVDERDRIQHQEIQAAQVEINAMRDRATTAELKIAEAVAALEEPMKIEIVPVEDKKEFNKKEFKPFNLVIGVESQREYTQLLLLTSSFIIDDAFYKMGYESRVTDSLYDALIGELSGDVPMDAFKLALQESAAEEKDVSIATPDDVSDLLEQFNKRVVS